MAKRMLQTTVRCSASPGVVLGLTFPDARGHYTIGKELADSVIDRVRRVAGEFYPCLLG